MSKHPYNDLRGFLLTRQWRDTQRGLEYTFWARTDDGPVRIQITDQEAVCFVRRDYQTNTGRRVQRDLQTLLGEAVDALYFPNQRDLYRFRDDTTLWEHWLLEADLKPVDRFLMERFIQGGFSINGAAEPANGYLYVRDPVMTAAEYDPEFTLAALDIETEGFRGTLYSIAVATPDAERVFLLGKGRRHEHTVFYETEHALLEAFFDWFAELDPDLILGWNVVGFDLEFLAWKCGQLGIPFRLGRVGETASILPAQTRRQQPIARIPGRVALDGIELLKLGHFTFPEFTLETVAQELLGRGKLLDGATRKIDAIRKLFRENPLELAEYNLEDCRLTLEIFQTANLIPFAVERSRLTGLALDRQGGSVAAFDFAYLPRLHRAGYVAPSVGGGPDPEMSPGGYILDSQPGLHDNVLLLDYKSLYPSIIRTFHVDPLALHVGENEPLDQTLEGYHGARFSRETHILPGMIESLWQERDNAKHNANVPLAHAIKIMMNSFYGVLGTPGCRFFDPRLAGSITRFGKEVLVSSKQFIESQGHTVIYGDTDSVFVLLGAGYSEADARAVGSELARALNRYWRDTLQRERNLESYLEVEFETHFLRFLMPTIRGSEKGSKKRYAGLVRDQDGNLDVVYRGLESVRTDWTPLAQRFQRELYRRVFLGESYDAYVRDTAGALLAGELDSELSYRKRLRKRVDEYTKNVPPHVRAARQLDNPGDYVTYVITVNGPEPVERRRSPFDYAHYLDKQLAPVANAILQFCGANFEQLTDLQMQIFESHG